MDHIDIQSTTRGHAFPDQAVATPCFVIHEDAVVRNLRRTVAACGGADRLVPHVKTHRAEWLVRLSLREGVQAFKCATPAEVDLVLRAGASRVIWAYPSVNRGNIARVLAVAARHPNARVTGIVDSADGLAVWQACMFERHPNVDLRIDLDLGMGRTGVPVSDKAEVLSAAIHATGRFAGWHAYDGHIKGDLQQRQRQVNENVEKVRGLMTALRLRGIEGDLVAGGSYTFDLWPSEIAAYVSPGSWAYSSSQHQEEIAELGWEQAAFVMTTVTSVREGTATLDAGSKAISPDKPMAERFRWDKRILLMSEEHAVVEAEGLNVGDRLLLTPRHTCTTAYLYNSGTVRTEQGSWETREQLGCAR